MNIHRPHFTQLKPRTDLTIYLCICSTVALLYFIMKRHFNLGGVLWFYNSPTTIAAATFLLLFFSKLTLNSRIVNWMAVSALAIYLTHSSSLLGHYYDHYIRLWHENESRPEFLLHVTLLIFAVFIVSILIDKVRLLLWHPIQSCIEKREKT